MGKLQELSEEGRQEEECEDDGDPGNPTVDFHGEKRRNDSHESTTDPESNLYRKSRGQAATLSYKVLFLYRDKPGRIRPYLRSWFQ